MIVGHDEYSTRGHDESMMGHDDSWGMMTARSLLWVMLISVMRMGDDDSRVMMLARRFMMIARS